MNRLNAENATVTSYCAQKGGVISELSVPIKRKRPQSAPTRPPSTSCAAWPRTASTRKRWLTVGQPGQPGLEMILSDCGMGHAPETSRQLRELVAKGALAPR